MIKIPVGEYLPDLPEHSNPGSLTATNVIPDAASYRPMPALEETTAALTARCQGSYRAKNASGTVSMVSGDATKLYLLSGATWNDASRVSGGAYSTDPSEAWEFVKWGESILATNYADDIQFLSLGASKFIALTGSPPKAKHIDVVRDFVVIGNIPSYPERVQWSGINDATTWSVSATTLSDYQELVGDGSAIQKIVGGEFGLIFQEHRVTRMTWAGSPIVFQFDAIETYRGCAAPQSVVKTGSMVFYFSDDGFYMTNGSGPSTPIGHGKVDRTILADIDQDYLSRMRAIADPINKLYMCSYAGAGNTNGIPNKIAIYNWAANRWSIVEQETEILCTSMTSGYTLDGLDVISSSIDALPLSLDSREYAGGILSVSAFTTNHKLANFSGTAMDATVDTTEAQIFPFLRAHVTSVRPMVQNNAATVKVGTRERDANTVTWGNVVSVNTSGECPVRSNGRYHRVRITTTGDFDHITGVHVNASPEGVR